MGSLGSSHLLRSGCECSCWAAWASAMIASIRQNFSQHFQCQKMQKFGNKKQQQIMHFH